MVRREKRAVEKRQRVQHGQSGFILTSIVIASDGAILDLALLTATYSAASSRF